MRGFRASRRFSQIFLRFAKPRNIPKTLSALQEMKLPSAAARFLILMNGEDIFCGTRPIYRYLLAAGCRIGGTRAAFPHSKNICQCSPGRMRHGKKYLPKETSVSRWSVLPKFRLFRFFEGADGWRNFQIMMQSCSFGSNEKTPAGSFFLCARVLVKTY